MGYNLAKQAMENNKSNETQNRREFFKEAAKKALPIIGAVALMSNPVVARAIENEATGCNNGCTGSCNYTCSGTCVGACSQQCQSSCKGTCSATCRDVCTKYNKQ